MAKERGLATEFKLDVEDDGPVDMPSFLDEMVADTERSKEREVPKRTEPRPLVSREKTKSPTPEAPRPLKVLDGSQGAQASNSPAPRPKRIHFNVTDKTESKLNELLELVRTSSVQSDTKNSELLDAFVDVFYSARDKLDLSSVPPRGQWGKPTAAAFRTALASAFRDSVAEAFIEQRQGELE